ncbi:MAG: uracil-DNA glycosylase [Conexivisphaerales archaeon]|jgi:DNA polymerase
MKRDELRAVAEEAAACTKCDLCRGRTNAVPGEGPANARIMLLGEAPGRTEDSTGRPFAGQAGRMLDRALSKAGLKREDVFITSVVKCRPPENREPDDDEIEACKSFLERQVDALKPKVIVLLGRVAYLSLTGRKSSIQRGPAGPYRGAVLYATCHPAVALHGRPRWLDALAVDLMSAAAIAEASR